MSSELDVMKEVWELSSFETERVPTPVLPVKWSIEKYKVAEMLALSGRNKKETARELGIPLAIINKWLQSSEFTEYMQSLVEDYARAIKNNRLMYLNKILQARIEQAEVEGYADLSRKDTVDIISEIRKETGDEKSSDNNYMRLLEKLVTHSSANVITLEEKP